MSGNVWERTEDCWNVNYDFSKGTMGVPTLENAPAATAATQIPPTTNGTPAYLKDVESS